MAAKVSKGSDAVKRFFAFNKRSVAAFVVVGILTAAVYFSLYTLLWKLLCLDYRIAVTVAYLGGVLFHFSMNRRITFRSRNAKALHQVGRYTVMIGFNYLLTMIIVEISVKILSLQPYWGVIFATCFTAVTGYLISKFWVFTPNAASL
ncbi:MAG: GtrA family protein [Nitrospirae bacterium]|nr:GtrA family protein [Nitrospirota bacterium]